MTGVRFGARGVDAPDGVKWRIGRRWVNRQLPRWRKVRAGTSADTLASSGVPTDVGSPEDLALVVAIFLGTAVFLVVLIPLLLFGIELVILGLLIAAGIIGRALFGRAWEVRATPTSGEPLAWRVTGIRRSDRVIDEVATALAAGRAPTPAETAEQVSLVGSAP